MSGNAGFSIIGQGLSADNVVDYLLNDFHAKTATVINEPKLAAALMGRMKYPVFRFKGQGIWDDDSAFSHIDAYQYADYLTNPIDGIAPRGCYVYGGNEFGSASLREQDDWTNRFIERVAQNGYRPLVHNQSVRNPYMGLVGWKFLRSSTEAAMQTGGGVGPHIYWRTTPSNERRAEKRNAYSNLDELRHLHGGNLLIISSEYAYDRSFGEGYAGLLSDEAYAEQLIEGAQLAWDDYRAYVQFYGLFPDQSNWSRFNLWLNETIKPVIAKWNRETSMDETLVPVLAPVPNDLTNPIQVKTTVNLNLRRTPTLGDSSLIRSIPTGAMVTVWTAPQIPFEDYLFVFVKDELGNTGYAVTGNKNGGSVFFDPPVLPAEPTYTIAQFMTAFEDALSKLPKSGYGPG